MVLLTFHLGAVGLQLAIRALLVRGAPLGGLAIVTYACGFMLTKWHD